MKKLQSFIVAFFYSFFIYLAVTNTLMQDRVLIGLAVSFMSGIVVIRFFNLPLKYLNPIRIIWFIIYLPFFFKEMVVANIKIMLIVLNPKLTIEPEFKKGKTELRSNYGKLLLTSSITLTPGTLSADLDGDEVIIHCVKTDKNAREIMAPFEKFIKRITE